MLALPVDEACELDATAEVLVLAAAFDVAAFEVAAPHVPPHVPAFDEDFWKKAPADASVEEPELLVEGVADVEAAAEVEEGAEDKATAEDTALAEDIAPAEDDVEQRPDGAPSAHFSWFDATPEQTSSTESDWPSRTNAYAVGPDTQDVSVCVRLFISWR